MSLKLSSPSFDPSPSCEAFYRALPPAPCDDASKIAGNLSLDQKQLCANVLSYFIIEGNAFGCEIGKRMRLVETNVLKSPEKGGPLRGRTVCEIQVEKDMCNIYGVLHGGCAAYMIDSCSSSSLVALGVVKGLDYSGMSQALNIIWHGPAPEGTKLKIVSTSVVVGGRVMTARCEIWDKDQGRVLVSAVHSKVNPYHHTRRLMAKM